MKREKPKNLSEVADRVEQKLYQVEQKKAALVNQVMGKVEKKWDGAADGYQGLIDAIHSDDPEHMKMVLGFPTSFP